MGFRLRAASETCSCTCREAAALVVAADVGQAEAAAAVRALQAAEAAAKSHEAAWASAAEQVQTCAAAPMRLVEALLLSSLRLLVPAQGIPA